MDRLILHSDCNCFYASVEALSHPELQNHPFAVGGDPQKRHGIILAKNQPAKQCGVSTGEPIWQAKQKCPDLVVLPPRFPLYLQYAQQARQLYLTYTDYVEPFGLDEAWLDVTAIYNSPKEGQHLADEIRRRMREELGITVSVGVSWNKIFAKLGSDYRKPDATTVFWKGNWKQRVWPLPVESLLFVGNSTRQKLLEYGVHTIGELAALPPRMLHTRFGKIGNLLWQYANGLENSPVARWGEKSPVKSIGNSVTTPRDLINDADVKLVLANLAEQVARRLRAQKLAARTIAISVRNTSLQTFTRQHSRRQYTTITQEILQDAFGLFQAHYTWKTPVRSIGVTVSDLVPDSQCVQTDLFVDETARVRAEHLDAALDHLKNRFGTQCVRPAVLLKDHSLTQTEAHDFSPLPPAGH